MCIDNDQKYTQQSMNFDSHHFKNENGDGDFADEDCDSEGDEDEDDYDDSNCQDEGKPLDLSEDCALLHCTEVTN